MTQTSNGINIVKVQNTIETLRLAASVLENALDDAIDIFRQHGETNKDEIWSDAENAAYDAATEVNCAGGDVGEKILVVTYALKKIKEGIEK